jgi:thymidine phosphorylase
MVSAVQGEEMRNGNSKPPQMRARRLGLNTGDEAVVFVREDCSVCRSEGFPTLARIRLSNATKSIIATLYTTTAFIEPGEVGLSESAWRSLETVEGEPLDVAHPKPLDSMSHVRSKIYGDKLAPAGLSNILDDVVHGRYSDVQLAAFITACSARPMDKDEVVALTRAMVEVGDRLSWDAHPIVDKHSVGGLPGNRTTPIVVAIVAAAGLTIPKTSSRAITSPAGTADMMETLAPVALDIAAMRRVVSSEGGCIVWGGAMHLSPTDEMLIRIERTLDLDSPGQLVASVLSKKIAAGSTDIVIDMPVGTTAKVRSADSAAALTSDIQAVAQAFGLNLRILLSDGSQPVGRGIGPALEARDVLEVLQGKDNAPPDLRERALVLAAALLEMGGKAKGDAGLVLAEEILESGQAWNKFQRICDAQGGMRTPPEPVLYKPFHAAHSGTVIAIDNRRLARIAKLAGAPEAKAAGVDSHVKVGQRVERGQPIYSVHAESRGELAYVQDYIENNDDPIMLAGDP